MKKLLQLSLLFVLLLATSFTTKAATYTYNPTLLTFSIELQANENLLITQSGINNVFTINTGTFTTGGTTAVGNNTASITVPIVDLTTSVTITKVANSGAITFSGTGALTSITVSIASTGSITSAATFNVNATNLSINSASSIGSTTNPIKGSIFNVGGTASAGDFCIENTGTNNLNTNSNTFSNTSGSIFLKSVGSLNILHQLQAVNNITLQTSGSTADIIITHGSIAGVLANNGIIKATSSRDLYFGISGLYGDSLGKGIDISAVRDINIQDYSYVQSNGSSGLKAIAGRDMRILDNSIFNGNTPTLTHIINAESLFIDNASTAANDSFIQINANNISLTNSGSINTTNVVALKPLTIGRTIDLGTATSTSLSLTNAQLKQIIASKLIIGDSNSGNVLISDVIDRNAITNIKVISGSNINFNPGTISSNGGTLELNALNIKPIVNATDAIASSTIITGGASFDINGTTIGTGASATYTQLKLVGSINITNATLAVSGTHTPVVGQLFTVIDNDGADAIVGTFIGLTEGAAIYNFLGSVFTATISYTGGSGNDVVLTVICPTITAATTTNPTTCGGVNGSIAFTTTNIPNGTYSLTYTGTGSPKNVTVTSNAFSLSGLNAGSYSNFSLSVAGCTPSDASTKTLSDPSLPTLTLGAGSIICAGTTSFTIPYTATTGLPTTYSISGPGMNAVVNATLPPSPITINLTGPSTIGNYSYTMTVKNAAGCTSTIITPTLAVVAVPTIAAGAVTNPTPCGVVDGSIAFTSTNVPNGTYSLSYTGIGSPQNITVSGNAFSLTGLVAGSYSNFSLTYGCLVSNNLIKTLNDLSVNISTIAACGSYTWANNNQNYTTSGIYTGTTTNCVTEKLNLTITPTTNTSSTVAVCNSYTWPANNQTYTTTGNYTIPALISGVIDNLASWTQNATTSNATVSANSLGGIPNSNPINLTLGLTNVSISANNGFYNAPTFVTTNTANQPVTIAFNPPVYGVIANYFLTDFDFNLISGNITVNYSNGTSVNRNVTTTTDTFGYFSSNLISSVVISSTQTSPNSWISLNNLKIAVNPFTCQTKTLNLTIVPAPAAPIATATQTFCGSATVANLTTTSGTNIKWYAGATGSTALLTTDALVTGTSYFASQTVNTCESTSRAEVIITIDALPTLTLGASSVICAGTTSFTIPYTATTGVPTTYSISGPGMNAVVDATLPPSPITINLNGPSSVGNYGYTMTVKNAAGCTSTLITPTLAVNALPAAPTAVDQSFCIVNNPTVASLVPAISATTIWYNAATGGTALVGTTTLTTGDYYVANLSGNCESNRTKVNVTITPVLVPTLGAYAICQNAVVLVGEGLVASNSTYTNTINDNIVAGPTFVRGSGSTRTTYTPSRPVFYKAYTIVSPISGDVTFETIFANLIPFDEDDTYLTLFQTSFNPANPATNFLRGDDDSGTGFLSSLTQTLVMGETYVIVVSSFGSNETGPFTLQASQNVFSNTPTVNWYTTASGGSPIFSGFLFNPVGVAGSGIADTATPATTTFYVASTDNVACRTAVTFTVNPVPVAGIAVGTQTACANSQLSSMIITGFTGTITEWQKSNSPSFSSPVDISSSNNAILSGPTLGTVSATTYFRAVISDGTCTTFSNVVVVSVISTTYDNSGTWSNGLPNSNMAIVFDKNFNISSDLSACACQVNTGVNVTVSNAATLSLVNNLDVQGSATMTFDNNTSLLQVNSLFPNTGNILYNRTTTPYEKFDYEYWSTPVSNPAMTLPVLNVPFADWRLTSAYKYAPENYNDDLLNDGYDDTGDDWSAITPTTVLQPGKGYAIMAPTDSVVFAPSAIANVTFEGIPNNGIILIPMVLSPIPASTIPYPQANYNLIGNPYPSAIDADNLINTNLPDISGSLYFWTHVGDLSLANPGIFPSNYNASDYALYNLSGGTAATSIGALAVPTGKIASGQGFFVKADTANPVLFTNDMRIANNNNQFFRSSNPFVTNTTTETIKDRFWLNLSNNSGMFSQQLMAYLPNSSLNFDKGYDGRYSKTSNYINFYSHLNNQDSDIYKIQSRGSFQDTDVVKLGYFSSVAGDFKISIDQVEGVLNAESTNIYLQDNLTNSIHNLKTSDYNFTTAVGDFNDRFVLRYTNQLLTNSEFEISKNDVIVYKNNQTINIVSTNTNLKEVQIYDIRGRLIAENKNINDKKSSFENLNIAQQILIVKTKTIDNKIITKKIVF